MPPASPARSLKDIKKKKKKFSEHEPLEIVDPPKTVAPLTATGLPPPPSGFPNYSFPTRCERLNPKIREQVERSSYQLYLEIEDAQAKKIELNDEWYRPRIFQMDREGVDRPLSLLHEHYAGMGGRSYMGTGVGGFSIGAACPSGGLCQIPAITYDLPWFAIVLNHYLRAIQIRDKEEEVDHVFSTMPNVFTCWQLNFGRNSSPVMSDTCFYNPHVDKNNAKVTSIGTAFGNYDGGGVWIAHPCGDTIVHFKQEVDGIHEGYVPGIVKHQKTQWLSFWAATKVHAIPPFRKNRVGIVAFSSQTALRITPLERKYLQILGFVMPNLNDDRFLPVLPDILKIGKSELPYLSKEDLNKRQKARVSYSVEFARHTKQNDKIVIAISSECHFINKNHILGTKTENSKLTNLRPISDQEIALIDERMSRRNQNDLSYTERESDELKNVMKSLSKDSRELMKTGNLKQLRSLKELWENMDFKYNEKLETGAACENSDDELIESYPDADLMRKQLSEKTLMMYPTKARALNESRKDRKRMESLRWRHKHKYGNLNNLPTYQPMYNKRCSTTTTMPSGGAATELSNEESARNFKRALNQHDDDDESNDSDDEASKRTQSTIKTQSTRSNTSISRYRHSQNKANIKKLQSINKQINKKQKPFHSMKKKIFIQKGSMKKVIVKRSFHKKKIIIKKGNHPRKKIIVKRPLHSMKKLATVSTMKKILKKKNNSPIKKKLAKKPSSTVKSAIVKKPHPSMKKVLVKKSHHTMKKVLIKKPLPKKKVQVKKPLPKKASAKKQLSKPTPKKKLIPKSKLKAKAKK